MTSQLQKSFLKSIEQFDEYNSVFGTASCSRLSWLRCNHHKKPNASFDIVSFLSIIIVQHYVKLTINLIRYGIKKNSKTIYTTYTIFWNTSVKYLLHSTFIYHTWPIELLSKVMYEHTCIPSCLNSQKQQTSFAIHTQYRRTFINYDRNMSNGFLIALSNIK